MGSKHLSNRNSAGVAIPGTSAYAAEIRPLGNAFFSCGNTVSADRAPSDGPENGSQRKIDAPFVVPSAGLRHVMEAEPVSSRPRSLLRDGTALDDLHADRQLTNSVFVRSDFNPIEPPTAPSDAFTRSESIKRQVLKMRGLVDRVEARDLPHMAVTKLAPFFGPKSKGAYGPKLPTHISYDPIDPVVIFKNAVPLVHCVLLRDPDGKEGLDLDGIAYIIERLDKAKQLRAHEIDIRFDVIEALSLFLSSILAKAEAGAPA